MDIAVVTLFPDLVAPLAQWGVVGRAVQRGQVRLSLEDPRTHAVDAHGTVDDRPYGGGPGMVMKVEPCTTAIRAARARLPAGSPVVFLTPQGERLDQARVRALAGLPGMLLVAGRYEGFDERLIEAEADLELSVGDFVLSGGELAAMVVIDAVARLLPGVLGDGQSAEQDSFSTDGLLDCPHYTRPEQVGDRKVPPVLLGGDHAAIRRWRRKQALGRTRLRRPELLAGRTLAPEDRLLLDEYLDEQRPATAATVADAGGLQ
jgi:tRNA (guanine37-N1)-methyltransferase